MAISTHEPDLEKETLLNETELDCDHDSNTEGPAEDSSSVAGRSSMNTLAEFDVDDTQTLLDIEKLAGVDKGNEEPIRSNSSRLVVWMLVNTFSTIGIVFTNKAIFDDPSFRQCQVAFAAFHFFITSLTLYVLSRPTFAMFQPKGARVRVLLPLAIAMCLNVILPNISLQFSSITFYQLARILLTPTVAMINYCAYKKSIPRSAAIALIPACLGVGVVSYFDSRPSSDPTIKPTSFLGVVFALAGVLASSLYTVWISSYQKKLEMSSMQLLYNQAPLGGIMLLYIVPWADNLPSWNVAPMSKFMLVLLSGGFASLLNISQFYIVSTAGPVSSTVVGHFKTCSIVALGWIASGRHVGDKSVLGILLALGGIMGYSFIMIRHKPA